MGDGREREEEEEEKNERLRMSDINLQCRKDKSLIMKHKKEKGKSTWKMGDGSE